MSDTTISNEFVLISISKDGSVDDKVTKLETKVPFIILEKNKRLEILKVLMSLKDTTAEFPDVDTSCFVTLDKICFLYNKKKVYYQYFIIPLMEDIKTEDIISYINPKDFGSVKINNLIINNLTKTLCMLIYEYL